MRRVGLFVVVMVCIAAVSGIAMLIGTDARGRRLREDGRAAGLLVGASVVAAATTATAGSGEPAADGLVLATITTALFTAAVIWTCFAFGRRYAERPRVLLATWLIGLVAIPATGWIVLAALVIAGCVAGVGACFN